MRRSSVRFGVAAPNLLRFKLFLNILVRMGLNAKDSVNHIAPPYGGAYVCH
ncbi:hypothetical protein KEN51_CDS0060 [Pseudomonas phage vB_Pae10145-KEN51]|nr:hypothetical protein [Pseudomonas phage PhiPizzaParty]